jgi:hypothetical protein
VRLSLNYEEGDGAGAELHLLLLLHALLWPELRLGPRLRLGRRWMVVKRLFAIDHAARPGSGLPFNW